MVTMTTPNRLLTSFILSLAVSACTSGGSGLAGGLNDRSAACPDVALSAEADQTLVWNQVMIDAVVAGTLKNPAAIRMAATVKTAMFDARNGVSREYTPIFVMQTAVPATHCGAAALQDAYLAL